MLARVLLIQGAAPGKNGEWLTLARPAFNDLCDNMKKILDDLELRVDFTKISRYSAVYQGATP